MNTITPQGTIEHVDPNTLIVEINVRSEAALDQDFLDSIQTNGVLTPIIGYRDAAGNIVVRAGQRRTRAAQQVALASVPVYTVDAAQTGAERIIQQLIENDQRQELTESDRIIAWKQLEIEGMSTTQIAKRVGAKRDRVKTGLAVASSDTGATLVSEHGLGLDQAAVMLEFDDDPEVVSNLTQIALTKPGYFDNAVEQVRQERATALLIAEATESAIAAGYRVLEERPDGDEGPYPLHVLETKNGKRVDKKDVEGKAGIAVLLYPTYGGGLQTSFYVEDPEAHGFKISDYYASNTRGPMTDEQKAERKLLIANNKEWDAAEVVRRAWLVQLIARKALPKDAVSVIAASLTHGRLFVAESMGHGSSQAQELLGLERSSHGNIEKYLEQHPNRALHVALAVALGGIEQRTSRNTWRRPETRMARYFETLAGWGYELSPVEKIAAMLAE